MEHLQRMGTRLPRAIWERLVGGLRLRHSNNLCIHIVIQLIQLGPGGRDLQVLLILMATMAMAMARIIRVVILAVVLVPVVAAVW
jgi:hypothetical protein